ncbi:MAG: ankyrin repeat domain-containing protein [Spirochaetales bacterium]|nr:ankyrin repeat domain-containing protein [Spirochaetales bacterium]
MKTNLILLFCIISAFSLYANPLDEALCKAAEKGDIDRAIELIEAGANVNNHSGGDGATPLHLAARYNRVEMIGFLLKKGAILNAKKGYDQTPLYWAAANCHPEAVDVLIKAGADVEAGNSHDQDTPLIGICWGGNSECGLKTITLLLEAGANPNAQSKNKSTALIYVARYGNVEMIKVLLRYKADPSITRHDGMNAYQIALAGGHTAAAKLLKDALAGNLPQDPAGGDVTIGIPEIEPNDTIKIAQNLDKEFVTTTNPSIQMTTKQNNSLIWGSCSYPWVSISGSGAKAEGKKKDYFDYFSFTARAGTKGVFDIDKGMKTSPEKSMDVVLILFDKDGTPLGGNNNCKDYSWYFGTDKGSEEDKNGMDSYFTWDFKTTGLYYLGLAAAGTDAEPGGFLPSEPLNPGGTYILNIAIQSHDQPVADTPVDVQDDVDDSDYSDDWYNNNMIGQCPFIYVYNGTIYKKDKEIIPNQVGKKADVYSDVVLESPMIINNVLYLQIRENKDEICSIDYLSVIINGREIKPYSAPAQILDEDNHYLELKKGDIIPLEFSVTDAVVDKIVVRAKGYYIPQ